LLYPFSTSALGGGRWSASRPGRFTPGKDQLPIVQKAGWAPGPVWTCSKNLAPTGIFFCRIVCFIVQVLDFQLSFVSYRTACCGFFQQEKPDGFGRERTRDLPVCSAVPQPLRHHVPPHSFYICIYHFSVV
jgi:hypothetical protein